MSQISSRFRILPLLVLVALAAFAVRMGDAFMGVRDIAAGAMAEIPVAENLVQMNEFEPAAGEPAPQVPVNVPAGTQTVKADETLPEVWADPGFEALGDSPGQMQLFNDLAARRAALDARERTILAKEALLAATEKQIDEKVSELADLREQIEGLLGQQDAQEQERITSLVKIYEGMKARDAAGIFNQMDMDILVQVVSRMSERKSAPIMAAMDKLKANQLTVMLSEMDRLPAARTDFKGTDFRGIAGGPVPTAAPEGSAPLPGLDALGTP